MSAGARRRYRFGQKLERHQPAELGVFGLAHHAHAAPTQLLESPIVRNGLADPLTLRRAKKLPVMLPVAADIGHDALIFRVAAQPVVVLVMLEPGIVVIPELDGAAKPGERLCILAEQG